MRGVAIFLLVALTGCQVVGTYSRDVASMSPEAEALAGARAAVSLEDRYGGIFRDRSAELRMRGVGRCLCEGTPALEGCYRYRLLNSDSVNAFSLPGGRVYITRGLYERLGADALLAAVIAHEMAHLTYRDHFRPGCDGDREVVLREKAADALAVRYLEAAGFDPQVMVRVLLMIGDALPRGSSDTRAEALERRTYGTTGNVAHANARE
ncbi:MAG: M48 family metallopeptidase [Phycisphaerales bacterium]|nr:MAG: M48 family metallopeptidase [Phycisphaerales bacterium]